MIFNAPGSPGLITSLISEQLIQRVIPQRWFVKFLNQCIGLFFLS